MPYNEVVLCPEKSGCVVEVLWKQYDANEKLFSILLERGFFCFIHGF